MINSVLYVDIQIYNQIDNHIENPFLHICYVLAIFPPFNTIFKKGIVYNYSVFVFNSNRWRYCQK